MTLSPEELGHILRERRLAQDLSAERLAAKANLTSATISRIERGEVRDPAYRLLSRVALVLGFGGVDEMIGQPVVSELDLLEPYYEGRARQAREGTKPPKAEEDPAIEAVIDRIEQVAPASAKRDATRRQEPPAPLDSAREKHPRMASPGTGRRGK